MRTERIQQEPGFVLHSRPYQNTSLLVELFTQSHGRIGAIAQGAKRSKSSKAALLQPLQLLSFNWSQRGELAKLTAVEPVSVAGAGASASASTSTSTTGLALWCGLYINELILRLTHRGDAHPELFTQYHDTLIALSHPETDQDLVLRYFECDLLAECGYGLALDVDAQGQAIDPAQQYQLVVEEGFYPISSGDSADQERSYSGELISLLSRREFLPMQHRSAARALLRKAIAKQLDRPLQTGAILRSLNSMQSSPQMNTTRVTS